MNSFLELLERPHESSESEIESIVEALNEALHQCRSFYSSSNLENDVIDSSGGVAKSEIVSLVLPIGLLLGNDDNLSSFVVSISTQMMGNETLWIKYGLERSGRPRGLGTSFNVRLNDFQLFVNDDNLRNWFLQFSKPGETTYQKEMKIVSFDFKKTNVLSTMMPASLRAHVLAAYDEINSLTSQLEESKNNLLQMKVDMETDRRLWKEANKKLARPSVYYSSKRDISSATPSAPSRNEKRQLDMTITSATKDLQMHSPDASAESYAYILSGMTAELLPDQQAISKANGVLVQIARNVIPIWRLLHAWVCQHKSDENIRKLHQILLMFVVGAHKERYADCTVNEVLQQLQIHDPTGRLIVIASKKKKQVLDIIGRSGGIQIMESDITSFISQFTPLFQGIVRKVNKNATPPDKINRIVQTWYRNSEPSPKKDDVVKLKQVDGVIISKQKRFSLQTEVLIRDDHIAKNKEHVSVGIFSRFKPFEICPASVNSCKCQTCEATRLLKIAVLKNSKSINEPIHLYVDVLLVLKRFKLTFLAIQRSRVVKAVPSDVPTVKQKEMNASFFKAIFRTIEIFAMKWPKQAIKCPRLLPYRQSLVQVCQMGISDMITNILCPRAMPTECNRSGQHRCYGLSDSKSWCQLCFGQAPPPPPPLLRANQDDPITLLNVRELKAQLKELGETQNGLKAELQHRLRNRLLLDKQGVANNDVPANLPAHSFPVRVCVLLSAQEIAAVHNLFSLQFENVGNQAALLATCASTWKADTTVAYSAWEDIEGVSTNILSDFSLSVKDFVEKFVGSLPYMASHKATLMQQRFALLSKEQGLLPHQIQLILDFIENMKVSVTRDEIQSAHWATQAVSIFAAVVQVVDVDIWNDIDGNLSKFDEVLCKCSDGSFEAGMVVEAYIESFDHTTTNFVNVRFMRKIASNPLEHGDLFNQRDWLTPHTVAIERKFIHKHKLITLPIVTISDDKNHDTAFVQQWLDDFFKPGGWLDAQDEIPDLRSRLSEVLIDSDGAASHFKSRFTLYFLLHLKRTYGFHFSWMVGCPGHGKGEHDGIGGTTKRKAERKILDDNLHLRDAFEVYKLVFGLFASPEKVLKMKNEYLKSRRVYRRWFVLYLPEEITKLRRRKDDEKDTVTQISAFKQYLKQGIGTRGIFWFEPSLPSSLTYRMKGCCCQFCLSSCDPNIAYEPRQACISVADNPWETQPVFSVRQRIDIFEGANVAGINDGEAMGTHVNNTLAAGNKILFFSCYVLLLYYISS